MCCIIPVVDLASGPVGSDHMFRGGGGGSGGGGGLVVEEDSFRQEPAKDGYFAFGIGRDRKNNVIIKVKKDSKTEIIEKKILKKEYKIQRIDGLPKKQVTPPKEVYERIKNDNILIGKARSINSNLDFFKNKSN